MKYAIVRNGCHTQQPENSAISLQQELEEIPIDKLDLETARH